MHYLVQYVRSGYIRLLADIDNQRLQYLRFIIILYISLWIVPRSPTCRVWYLAPPISLYRKKIGYLSSQFSISGFQNAPLCLWAPMYTFTSYPDVLQTPRLFWDTLLCRRRWKDWEIFGYFSFHLPFGVSLNYRLLYLLRLRCVRHVRELNLNFTIRARFAAVWRFTIKILD